MPAIYSAAEMVAELVLRLGNRTDLGPTTPGGSGRIAKFLNTAQIMLATSPMAMETLDVVSAGSTSRIVCVAGQPTYDLLTTIGTNILGIRDMRNDTSGNRMRKFPWQEWRSLNQQASGSPLRWTRWGNTVAFDPIPDAADVIRVDYRREPQLGVIEVPNRYQESLLDLAEFIGWKALQQHDKASLIYKSMPAIVQLIASSPMDQDQWESMYNDDLAMRPIGFEPYTTMQS